MTDEDRNSNEQSPGPDEAAGATSGAPTSAGEASAGEPVASQPAHRADPTVPANPPSGRSSKWWVLTASLALLLAVAAAAGTGLSWWHGRRLAGAVAAADARTQAALQRLQSSVGSLTDELSGLRQQTRQTMQQSKQRIDELDRHLQPIPESLAQLRQQLAALQGGSVAVRATWLRGEARYYLRVANARLQLAHDWHGAIEALQLADGRLQALADPGLAPVRRLIAREIDALQAVQLPDIDGLAARLDALAGRAGTLPLRAAAPTRFEPHAPPTAKAQPGLGRFWGAIKRALESLVRVRRREQPVRRALTDEQRALIRDRLAVELQLAEMAAVRRRPGAFRANVDAARRLLTEDFDGSDPGVAAAERTLMQMSGIDVAPSPPDISQSLARLQAGGGGI